MGTGQEQVKRELLLDGLDCANCALKIENGVKKIKGINECSVNFVTKTLSLHTTSDMDEQVVEEAKRKVLRLEPHIRISEKGKQMNGHVHAHTGSAAGSHDHGHDHAGHDHGHSHSHGNHSHTHDHGDSQVHAHEHGSHAGHNHDHSHTHDHDAHAGHSHEHGAGQTKVLLARLAAGSVLLAAAIWSPLEGWAQFTLYALAYLIAGETSCSRHPKTSSAVRCSMNTS